MITISTTISQVPRLKRKILAFAGVLCCDDRYADSPDKKTKIGAQKWVIHLVKNKIPVVVCGSSGLAVIAPM
nr:hypothetical protein [Pedobacter agri]